MSNEGMSNDALLNAVSELATIGGREALRFFRGRVEPEYKSDGSPVTAADRRAEERMRDWIRARFPEDGILGEELGEERPAAERRWILDPIDGTVAFARGVPLWGTLVAVARGDTVLAAAINCAALSEMACAATGKGCWIDGTRARVSTTHELSRALVLTTDQGFRKTPERAAGWHALASAASTRRGWGDCYGYLLVATGRAEVMVDPVMAPWDSAALQPIITEAGGVFTDWSGRATGFGGSAIATNAALAADARAILRGGTT